MCKINTHGLSLGGQRCSTFRDKMEIALIAVNGALILAIAGVIYRAGRIEGQVQ